MRAIIGARNIARAYTFIRCEKSSTLRKSFSYLRPDFARLEKRNRGVGKSRLKKGRECENVVLRIRVFLLLKIVLLLLREKERERERENSKCYAFG